MKPTKNSQWPNIVFQLDVTSTKSGRFGGSTEVRFGSPIEVSLDSNIEVRLRGYLPQPSLGELWVLHTVTFTGCFDWHTIRLSGNEFDQFIPVENNGVNIQQ